MAKILDTYLKDNLNKDLDAKMVAYVASLETVNEVSPSVAAYIVNELADQRSNLKLIASENFSSEAVQLTMGNLLTDKYSEGFPYHRFYAGCDNVDALEAEAVEKACQLFGCDHAYVQPHSGADANLCAYWAILNHKVQVPLLEEIGITNPSDLSREDWNKVRKAVGNQRLLGMDYYSGGHLTHGYRQNVSAQMFDAYTYKVNKETGLLDYDELEKMVKEIKPLIFLAGYSAYPRKIDFKKLSQIAHDNGAVFMVDMAHFAGLVAGKVFIDEFNPFPWADVVTTTTHKTLRGPRGGMVLCKEEYSEAVNKGCPLVLGGPLPHVMAAKAVAFTEALSTDFQNYASQIVKNSDTLAKAFIKNGVTVATNGTDNHLMLLDVTNFNLNGKQAEYVLRTAGITLNRNALPFDPNGPWYTSGLRIGTPAVTTLKMGEKEMLEIADIITSVLKNSVPTILSKGRNAGKPSKAKAVCNEQIRAEMKKRVETLLDKFLLYPSLDLDFLQKHFPLN